jgi:hypothetical protein
MAGVYAALQLCGCALLRNPPAPVVEQIKPAAAVPNNRATDTVLDSNPLASSPASKAVADEEDDMEGSFAIDEGMAEREQGFVTEPARSGSVSSIQGKGTFWQQLCLARPWLTCNTSTNLETLHTSADL